MSQYRSGVINSTTALISSGVDLKLGFIPNRFRTINLTLLETGTTTGIGGIEWVDAMPAASAFTYTYTNGIGAGAIAYVTTNGITPVVLGGDWQNTQYVITAFVPSTGVVTISSLSPTNTLTLVNGMTVTISGVVGSTQLNTNRYLVRSISGSTFKLSDLFGNPVDTTGFGTYVSGGIVNEISYPATAAVIDATTGAVTTPGQPAGNQYDIGWEGLHLGSAALGANADAIWWEAITQTPTGW